MSIRREPRRAPSVVRKVVIAVVLVAALLAAADFGLRLWAQSWVASRLQDSLDTSAPPDIELQGFPFLAQFASGRFSGIDATIPAVDAKGLQLRSIHLDLDDVTFARGSLITHGSGRIHVRSGSGEIQVTEEALTAYVQRRGIPVEVALVGDRVRVSTDLEGAGATGTASATGDLELEEGHLVFAPTDVEIDGSIAVPPAALSFDVPVPRVLRGIRYGEIAIGDGLVRVSVSLRDTVLRLQTP